MNQPIIVEQKPVVLELEAGTYYWCSCGRAKNQPFCDGSHKGTEMTPVKFELAEKQTVALCNCKHSQNGAFCDGAHVKL